MVGRGTQAGAPREGERVQVSLFRGVGTRGEEGGNGEGG